MLRKSEWFGVVSFHYVAKPRSRRERVQMGKDKGGEKSREGEGVKSGEEEGRGGKQKMPEMCQLLLGWTSRWALGLFPP